jgi:hypothetical protein
VANTEGTSGSIFRRFGERISQLLQSKQLPFAVQIVVALSLFIGGIGFERLLDIGFAEVFTGQQGAIALIMLLFALGAFVLTIVTSILIGHFIHGHRAILEGVESRFGITAQYVPDKGVHGSGVTYTETRKLIERANKSLIFVDWWVGTSDHPESQARKEYYQAIPKRIRRYRKENPASRRGFVHKRIIQMPRDTNLSVMARDTVYAEHIRECVELEAEVDGGITSVYRASPFTYIHFAIIDDKYLVQPILTTDPGGLTRLGAIIFTDPTGSRKLIEVYEEMIEHLNLHRLTNEDISSLSAGSQATQPG